MLETHHNHWMDEINTINSTQPNKFDNNVYASLLFYAIHFYFITLFEVLFYLYYILPYEQQLLFGLFEFDSNQLTTKYNITVTASDLYDTEHCRNDTQRIQRANTPLYIYCYYYIAFINICLLGMFCYDVWLNFYVSKNTNTGENTGKTKIKTIKAATLTTPTANGLTKNTFSFSSVDAQEVELGSMNESNQEDGNEENTVAVKENTVAVKEELQINSSSSSSSSPSYWKDSLFVAEFVRSIYFICFIGVFEYLFFTQIVDHFKVFDLKMVLCNLFK